VSPGWQSDNAAIYRDVPALQCTGIGKLGCHGDDGDFPVGNAILWSVHDSRKDGKSTLFYFANAPEDVVIEVTLSVVRVFETEGGGI
jgi:hypothetical protein